MPAPRTIPHAVLATAERTDTIAIVDGPRRITYAQLSEAMLKAADCFTSVGLKKKDRVAIWAPNSLDWIVAALGVQAAGGCIVPLNTRFKGPEAQYVLNHSRAKILISADRFLGVSYPALLDGLELPYLERRILISPESGLHESWETFLSTPHGQSADRALRRLDQLSGDEPSDIIFTSGTTGAPKGVQTTHSQNVRVYQTWARTSTLAAGDRYAITYPFFHCAGYKAGWLSCFLTGATAFPLPTVDAAQLSALVAAEKITFLAGPPTLFQMLLAVPPEQRGDLRSVRVANTGAASVPPSVIERMRTELQIQSVMTGYGLTETCGTVTLTHPDDEAEIITRYCGRAIDGVEIRCVDESNRSTPPGTPGEVVVRGYNVMQGYFEDEAATSEAIDEHGWLHTGDIGVLEQNGYLRLTDRKKDMFIVGGFNCYPAEIEKIMCSNPQFAQVAVIGVPDERMGEVGKAYVVTRPGEKVTPQDVIDWCKRHMANYKVPRYVEIVDSLPMNATGKVQKFVLRGASGKQP